MSTKVYIAYNTQLSTQFRYMGRLVTIDFQPYSNRETGVGGSIFSTDIKELQESIESDPRYGSLFHLKSIDNMEPARWNQLHEGLGEDEPVEIQEKELKHIEVTSVKEAYTYLQDNFQWNPKTRPTKSSIVKAAEKYGIVFDGI